MARTWWLLILLVLALPVRVTAAEDVKQSDPVVVTATKVETRRSELGAAVDVLTEQDLEAFNYDRIEEALRQVPGVEIRRSGTLGKTTNIQIRGFNSNRVQVLVDGMRVKSPTLGAADLSELSLDAIEKIEIVRGPQSTLHGTDAMGGVVNIITKKGQGPPRGTLSVEGGSHGTFREVASSSGSIGRFNYSLSGSRQDSSGLFDRIDDSDLTAFAGRLGFDLPWKAEVWVSGRYAKARTDLPVHSTNPTVFDPNSQQQTETYLYNLNYKQAIFPWWDVSLRYGQWWNNQGFQDPPPPGDLFTGDDIATNAFANPRSQIDTRRREFEVINVFRETSWATLIVGAQHVNERGTNRSICSPLLPLFIVLIGDCERSSFAFRQEINTISVYGQQDLRFFDRLFLSGGLRWDDNDQFGDEVTPRVSAALVIKETGTRLRAAWGKGFRAPTINDLIFPGFGSPRVGPERSESYEAGFDQELWARRVRFGSTYFHNEMRNLIQAVCNDIFTVCVAANVGGARSQGLENYIEFDPLDWLGAYVNYTFTDTRNTTTGADLPQFARHNWNAGVTARPIERLRLFAQAHVQSSEFVSSFAGRKPGFYRIDVGGAYRLFGRRGHHESTDLTLRIENVTNERYEEVLGFRAFGVHAMVGLRVAFQ